MVVSSNLEVAKKIHRETVVVDMLTSLLTEAFPDAVGHYREGGVSAFSHTIDDPREYNPRLSYIDVEPSTEAAFRWIAYVRSLVQKLPKELALIERYEDFARLIPEGKIGVILNAQNTTPFELRLDLVDELYAAGLRVVGLAYNIRNFVADGCFEESNAGLSRFGRRLIGEMNRVGFVIDGTHTGERSTLEAMEISEAPMIFSHVGCKALFDHPRNITDEQIRKCAEGGGVVGIFFLPTQLNGRGKATVDELTGHIMHAVEVGGVDHVGIGTDWWSAMGPYRKNRAKAPPLGDPADIRPLIYGRSSGPTAVTGSSPAAGSSPAPSAAGVDLYGIEGIETPAGMHRLTSTLLDRGLSVEEATKIMGGNFLRVFQRVWR
jgi:membrane dipeptidase